MKKTFRFVAMIALLLPITATSQVISVFPHTEDLESWSTCGTSCSAACALSNGWTNTAANPWSTDVGGTGSSGTGPSVDHTTGTPSGKYLYTETSGCTGTERHLVSPPIDLVGANDMQFTFWWHALGAAMGNTHVDVSNDDGTTWNLDVIPDLTDDLDLWQQAVVSLGTWTGDTVRVRLRYEGNTTFTGDFAVDDFYIFDLLAVDAGISAFVNPVIPTCVFNDTVSVQLTNFGTDTLTSVSINWSFNAAGQTPVAWTGALAPGAATTVFLGTATYSNGSDLVAFTSLPNGINEFGSGAGNDTSSIIGLSTGLSGIYTVGGATPDYVDLTTAVADLNTFGTCSSVIFDIRDGIYTEQIELIDLPSLAANNTVTFRSENADASLVTISNAGSNTGNNYVVRMNGADHYKFENLTLENTGTTYARILEYTGGCDSNMFEGCHMMSVNGNNTGTNAAMIYSNTDVDNGNVFMNNIIEGGSYGMYFYGGGTTSGEVGTVIEGNHFLSNYYYGVRLYYQDAVIVKDNKIDGPSTYTGTRYALYASYLNQSPEITGNRITGTATSGWRYGLYWFNGGGTPVASGKVENNMITVGYAGNTATCYGIYMSNIGYMDLYHNSVLVSAGGTSSRALYTATGGGNIVKNNILANYSGGYAFYMTNVFAVSESDYNVLYSPAGNTGYMSGNQATLANWQSATGFDGNSININPNFYSSTNLHVCNDSIGDQGTPIATITTDIDGHIRDLVNPDMGADEFVGISGSFLGPDAVVCTGDSVMLSVGAPADTILWSTGDTTSFIWVSSPGTYTVTINSVCGAGSDAIVVNQSALVYTNYVTASDLEFCNGDSVLLTGTQMADTYQWSGGSSSTNDSTYATTGGAYTLAITDACGSGSETITLTMNDVPVPSFSSTLSYLTATFTNTSTTGPNLTYLWDFGDGNTSTIPNPGNIYAASGAYNVTLTITNDCGTTTFSDSILLTVAGIDELLVNGDVNVYPNPSNGEFTIDMELISNSNVSFRVENLVGALVYETQSITVEGAHSETISLGNVPTGVYFVNIQVGDNNLVKKLIIE